MPYTVECRLNGEVFDTSPQMAKDEISTVLIALGMIHKKFITADDDFFVVETPAGKLEYRITEEK